MKSVIILQVPVYRPENFQIITKEKWQEYIDNEFTDASIQSMDKDEVENVESFMKRVTLKDNTLKFFDDRNIKTCQPDELRVVLVGKVRKVYLALYYLF